MLISRPIGRLIRYNVRLVSASWCSQQQVAGFLSGCSLLICDITLPPMSISFDIKLCTKLYPIHVLVKHEHSCATFGIVGSQLILHAYCNLRICPYSPLWFHSRSPIPAYHIALPTMAVLLLPFFKPDRQGPHARAALEPQLDYFILFCWLASSFSIHTSMLRVFIRFSC